MKNIKRENATDIKARRTNKINFPPATHEYIEFIFVEHGSGTAYCDGCEYKLEDDSMFIVFPNQVHSYEEFTEEEDSMYYVLLCSPTHVRMDTDIFYKKIPKVAARICKSRDLRDLFMVATQQYLFGKPTVLQDVASAIINLIITWYELVDRSPDTTVQKILNYCNENYRNDISVEQMSKDLYISKSAIARFFSAMLKTNFRTYINSLRIDDALQMIIANQYSIAEAATTAGFNSIRTFNRAFLEKYGCSPKEYLEKMKKRRVDL